MSLHIAGVDPLPEPVPTASEFFEVQVLIPDMGIRTVRIYEKPFAVLGGYGEYDLTIEIMRGGEWAPLVDPSTSLGHLQPSISLIGTKGPWRNKTITTTLTVKEGEMD